MKLGEKIAVTVFFVVWSLIESIYMTFKAAESLDNDKVGRAMNEILLAMLTPSVIAGTAMYFCWEVIL